MDNEMTNDQNKRLQWGMHDAVVGSIVLHDIPSKTVYVSNKGELVLFADQPAGTIAATYGFANMWQKKPDGTWATIIEESD